MKGKGAAVEGEKSEREAEAGGGSAETIALSLDTLEHTREDLASMTQRYLDGKVSDMRYRAFVYGCNSITKLLVHAKTRELEARIVQLEKAAGR